MPSARPKRSPVSGPLPPSAIGTTRERASTRVAGPPPSGPAYPPISDYALIGDCHSAALVSRSGSIDWCCLPRFDSDSSFGRLLDWRKGGYFAITPVGRYRVKREYRGDSLVLLPTTE